MKIKIHQITILGMLLIPLLPAENIAAEGTVDINKIKYSYPLDLLLPGYGAAIHGSYIPAALIFTGRLLTAYIASDSWRMRESYASTERAARLAGYYYGPGYRYYDPVSGGFKSPDEFGRLRDRHASYYGTALGLHALITGISLFYTHELNENVRIRNLPAVEIGLSGMEVTLIRLDF